MPCSLVTGCAGFIGSHVAEALLARGHDVLGVDDLSGGVRDNVPAGVRLFCGPVGDEALIRSLFRAQRIDYVFHLAAYAAEGLSHFVRRFNYENNVTSTMTLINESVNAAVECFVFTSSIAVYGHAVPPFGEETIPQPADPYGIAKLAVELDLAAARRIFGMPSIVFRLHNVYGERQNIADPYRNVVGIFMRQLLHGQPATIYGDGSQTRAFTYVGDVAPAIAGSVHRPRCYNRTFNLGSDEVFSVGEVARLTAAALGVPLAVRYLDQRNEVMHAFACHDRQREYFGDLCEHVSLPDGLARMASWVRTRGSRTTALPAIEVLKNLPRHWYDLAAATTTTVGAFAAPTVSSPPPRPQR